MANEETGFGTIKCPGCGEAIPVSEAIHHQIAERTRQEFKAEALEAKRLLAARARELDEKAAAFDQTISDRLVAERANLSKEIEARLRSGLSTEIADLMYGDLQGLVGSSLPTIPALTSDTQA